MGIKVIITGATGLVGEGILLTCLAHPEVQEILMVNRKHFDLQHFKLKELIVPNFLALDNFTEELKGYDACFYCAGISSVGMDEAKYSTITYDTTIYFAQTLSKLNPDMVFNFVSGNHTDSSEKGKLMWARVKGKTENMLKTIPFKAQYNFRPGGMKPVKGQKNAKVIYKIIISMIALVIPKQICSLHEIGLAMVNAVTKSYLKQILEIEDIKVLAKA